MRSNGRNAYAISVWNGSTEVEGMENTLVPSTHIAQSNFANAHFSVILIRQK